LSPECGKGYFIQKYLPVKTALPFAFKCYCASKNSHSSLSPKSSAAAFTADIF
jgi:hypothetical protein